MRIYSDYFIVLVNHLYDDEDKKSKSGIILLNQEWISPEDDQRFKYKRLYGQCIGTPSAFTDTRVLPIDPGTPKPNPYVSSDDIQDLINRGYAKNSRKDYYPSTFEGYEFNTLQDVAKLVDVKQDDKVYFNELATEPEGFMGKVKDGDKIKLMYKIRVDHIMGVVRDGKFIAQGGWLFVKPDMETWEEINTKSGIIKKPRPEAKYLRGYVKHVRDGIDIKTDDHIMYTHDADWELTIEGQKMYAIQEKDILCTINDEV